MATIADIRNARLDKLAQMKKAGLLAYPGKVRRTHAIGQALEDFAALSKKEKELIVAGRVRALREHGGSTFLHVEDGTGTLQAFFKRDRLGEQSYKFFLDHVDVGDVVQIHGVLFTTARGEKTIEAAGYSLLAKSLLPLPDKWHGLQDVDERFRKRYLDLLFNPEIKRAFVLRSRVVSAIREFLEKEGFMEVETPVLQPLYGGTEALPFKTRLNAFDMDMYLRIAPELYLKRLIVGGFEKVYEIGRVFRNEGVDRMHNPDFTMLEFYWAYADYKDMMKLIEKMFLHVLKKALGKTTIEYEGRTIDFKTPWPRIEYTDLLRKEAGVDIVAESRDALAAKAKKLGIEVDKHAGKARVIDELYKKLCRPKIWNPSFVIHHPVGMMPLAKKLDTNPSFLGSLQVLLGGGWELVKAYDELNDPLEQRAMFEEQEKLYKAGLEDAQRMDEDFVEALEYGMPPTAGFGMGIDRLCALLTNSHSLREIILFPTMKPRSS